MGTAPYGYSYDNIGSRKTAQELAQELTYAANELNQYTRIANSTLNSPPSTLKAPFVPQYDASGNQTLIRTSTGIWTVMYNAANRAVSFTSRDGATIVECGYDYQGRRYMKKVTQNGTVASHERYLYRGYLQLAALDMLNSRNVLRTLLWDPLEPVASRPLALVQGNALYCYGTDFNKNVTEVFDGQGTTAVAYDYSPYGIVGSAGNLVQPVQWSSEMNDGELALVYYNYRYYNPADGRWINRDPIAEQSGWNLYSFIENRINIEIDLLGFKTILIDESEQLEKEKYIKFLIGVKGKASCDIFGRTSKLEEMETNIAIEYENYVDKKIIKTDVLMNLDTHFKARVYVQANGFTSSAHHMTHAGSSMCTASIPCAFKFPVLGVILCAGGIVLIAIPHICDMTWNIEGSYLIEVKSDGCNRDGAVCYPKLDKKIEKEN